MERQSAPPVNDFKEDSYNGEWLLIGRFLKNDDDGRCDDKRRGRTAPKEGVPILSTERKNLEDPEKAERRTAPSNSKHRRPTEVDIGVPREPLV